MRIMKMITKARDNNYLKGILKKLEKKYNFKEREKIESSNGSQKISVFVKLWCWIIGIKPNSLWMPKTNKDIERMSFIEKLRYKTKMYIKQNK